MKSTSVKKKYLYTFSPEAYQEKVQAWKEVPAEKKSLERQNESDESQTLITRSGFIGGCERGKWWNNEEDKG